MGRPLCGFLLSLRCGSELAKSFAEPRLAELPTNGRGLQPNAPYHVLEDEAVAVQPNGHTETSAELVQIVPAS